MSCCGGNTRVAAARKIEKDARETKRNIARHLKKTSVASLHAEFEDNHNDHCEKDETRIRYSSLDIERQTPQSASAGARPNGRAGLSPEEMAAISSEMAVLGVLGYAMPAVLDPGEYSQEHNGSKDGRHQFSNHPSIQSTDISVTPGMQSFQTKNNLSRDALAPFKFHDLATLERHGYTERLH